MRRMLVVGGIAAAAAGAIAMALALRGARVGGPRPVVPLSIDPLRADHLPISGFRGVATPAIDALARRAVVFENAYAHAPQTLPSHVSIMSGRLPFAHGVRDNVGFTVRS